MKNIPERIWLQTYDPASEAEDDGNIDFEELHKNGVVTWESEPIFGNDIEYVRPESQWRKYAEQPPQEADIVAVVMFKDGKTGVSHSFTLADGTARFDVSGNGSPVLLWMPLPTIPEELKTEIVPKL